MANIKNISMYKGRYCAELENGEYILSNGSMELMRCEKTDDGMLVKEVGLVSGIMMRDLEEFKWCVENCLENPKE